VGNEAKLVIQGNHDVPPALTFATGGAKVPFEDQELLYTHARLLRPNEVVLVPAKRSAFGTTTTTATTSSSSSSSSNSPEGATQTGESDDPLRIFASRWSARGGKGRLDGASGCNLFLTHEPPKGLLDSFWRDGQSYSFEGACEEDLLGDLQRLAFEGRAPKVSAFGHLHEYAGIIQGDHPVYPGVVFINCAMASDGMKAKKMKNVPHC